jgi:hypothetical protein
MTKPKKLTKPPHEPNDKAKAAVEQMSAVGIPQEDIAMVLDIDPKTLRKHYRKELDQAAIKANSAIGGALYNKAKAGDTTAMIWWTKTRMQWSEKFINEHTGAGGGPIQSIRTTMTQDEAAKAYSEMVKSNGNKQ